MLIENSSKLLENFINRFGKNFNFVILSIFQSLINFVVFYFLSIFLGVEQYGKFLTLTTSLAILLALFTFNSYLYSIQLIKTQKTYEFVGKIYLATLIPALLSCILIFIASFYTSNLFVYFKLILIILFSLSRVFRTIFISNEQLKKLFLFESIFILTFGLLKIFTAFFYKNYLLIIDLMIIEAFLINIFYLLYSKKIYKVKLKYDPSFHFRFIKKNSPTLICIFLSLLVFKFDRLISANFLNEYEHGIYMFTTKLSDFMSIIIIAFNSIYVPRLINLYKKNKYDFEKFFKKLIRNTYYIGLFLSIIIGFLYSKYLVYFFPEQYEDSKKIFTIVFFNSFLFSINNIAIVWFMCNSFMVKNFYRSLLSLIIFIPIWIISIKYFGLEGIAYSSFLACFFHLFISYAIVGKNNQAFFFISSLYKH